ncbi:MAG TPA: RES family NAD+ phosphorylase [Chitinophagaceae bacterium]|nr:RES family NAD+ phosphorylase [Chitinophagaceae bacterium]
MIVYRVGATKWAGVLNGEGARLYGGRWNEPGKPCIYTSENRSLAVLEYTVNINIDDIPRRLSITTIEINGSILKNSVSDLPGNWRASPLPASTQQFGSRQLEAAKYGILVFPSAIIPEEFNYILNPLHLDAASFKVLDVSDFVYDVRIKTV